MRRSREQSRLIVIWTAVILAVLMGLFPPWQESLDAQGVHIQRDLGYGSVLLPPEAAGGDIWVVSIDLMRLALQWVLVTMIAGAALYTLREKR